MISRSCRTRSSLTWRGGTHALHLVQKQRALVGDLKQAQAAALFGAGEGPLLIAEELALQQVFREGRHVDGHEGPVPPPGGPVDRVGEQLLAGAGLADQQDGGADSHPLQHLALCTSAGRRLPTTSSKVYLAR